MYGATRNPINRRFTAGGSSSGEGALIGAGGSILGFGLDAFGNIRCPAHICGVCGLLPTHNRISSRGLEGKRFYGFGFSCDRDEDNKLKIVVK